ncbi:hypothetical protein RB200_25290 [Streptomyces sp. PmtG]
MNSRTKMRLGPTVPAIAFLVGAFAVSGCSGESNRDDSSIRLPKRVCWNAFEGEKVEDLLPRGGDATIDDRLDFDLYKSKQSASCLVYVDGNTKFSASANRNAQSPEDIDWSTWKSANPSSINAGDKGISWSTRFSSGAAAYFTCERPSSLPSEEAHWPNSYKYIELELRASGPAKPKEAQKRISSLMDDFVNFSKRKLKCKVQ